mmetsp:Transcript_24062/g.37866  ORF Transcript_24062/g.37866 Transcript_24062/m.37866 type:complete len:336 (-) Transcript_24062:1713-2720(-)
MNKSEASIGTPPTMITRCLRLRLLRLVVITPVFTPVPVPVPSCLLVPVLPPVLSTPFPPPPIFALVEPPSPLTSVFQLLSPLESAFALLPATSAVPSPPGIASDCFLPLICSFSLSAWAAFSFCCCFHFLARDEIPSALYRSPSNLYVLTSSLKQSKLDALVSTLSILPILFPSMDPDTDPEPVPDPEILSETPSWSTSSRPRVRSIMLSRSSSLTSFAGLKTALAPNLRAASISFLSSSFLISFSSLAVAVLSLVRILSMYSFFCWVDNTLSSIEPDVTKRYTCTTRFWPIRWHLAIACRSGCGFQSESYKITVSALCRLIPRPPARVWRIKIE